MHSTNSKHDMMALKIDTLPICNYYVLSNSHLYLVHMYLVALFVISSHNLKLPQLKKEQKKRKQTNPKPRRVMKVKFAVQSTEL